VGALSGLLVVSAFARFGLEPRGLIVAAVACVLVAVSAIDIERRLIPNRIVVPATAAILVAQAAFFPDRVGEWVGAALVAGLLLGVPALLFPAGLGMGDAKLAVLIGAALGWDFLDALVIGFLATFPVGVVMLVRGGMAARKATIPLGPFLAGGALVALFLQ
jgi:leader peptidase (prepilin peptidase)/N-methyltransferase